MFIRSKPAGGRTYYQAVESYRDNGRVRHRTLASLGTHSTIEEARTAALKEYRALPRSRDIRDRMAWACREDAWNRVLLLDDLARRWHTQKGTAYQEDDAVEETRREREVERQKEHAKWEKQQLRSEKDAARRNAEWQAKFREQDRAWAEAERKDHQRRVEVAHKQALKALEALGLLPKPEAIQAAYRRKSRECHPDHGGSNEAMAKINTAYENLVDYIIDSRQGRRGAIGSDPAPR
jgi:hypothetical protein